MGIFSSQQISSYLSRLAAKRSVEVHQHDSEDKTPGEGLQSVLSERFCLKSAFSIHIQSFMTPTTSVG